MNIAANIKQPKLLKRISLLVAGCMLALTMCVPNGQDPGKRFSETTGYTSATPAPDAAQQSTATPGIPQGAAYDCLPRSTLIQSGVVEKVVDGDTIHVEIGGQTYIVRYIGVDTPETHHPVRGKEPYGVEAAERNQQLVMGKTVTLVKDVSETDQYDRLLRYVLAGDVFVNTKLVTEGYARAVTYPPDIACRAVFSAEEEAAREANRGLWGLPTATPLTKISIVLPGGTDCALGCDEEQTGCAIKGNINAEGVKIYHLPGSRDYDKTRINSEKGEKWFCSETEAQANGWRAAQ